MANSQAPLYQQVAIDLTRRIQAGEWAPGSPLPAEEVLAAHYAVSRITVRKAIGVLIAAESVQKRRGASATVASAQNPVPAATVIAPPTGFIQERFAAEKQTRFTLNPAYADARLAARLQVPVGTALWCLTRHVFDADGMVALFQTYFTAEALSVGRLRQSLNGGHSFYAFLRGEALSPQVQREEITALDEDAGLRAIFGFKNARPLLRRQRVVASASGNYREYSDCYYAADRYRFILDFASDGHEAEPF
ncbi:GntR family transcriptional regulator [Lacticaseibacillus yichunensis]|uniref:GntR family transcriptional regulator n=1 Tax=Lacticaseibacillus yichunensis TaxID=2486015 RepID=A0ABW4CT10_9LACO|nr:GntR family transcriptional regulator [Lacticaseibacillus yichunensis]